MITTFLATHAWVWWLVGTAYLVAVALLLAKTETSLQDFSYAAALAAVVFCALLLLFVRPAVAGLGVFIVVVSLIQLSCLRFDRTGSNLHAYDLVYFTSDLPALGFWIKNDRDTAMPLLAKTAAILVLPIIVGMTEPPMVGRWPVALCLTLAIAAFGIAKSFVVPWHYWEKFGRPVHFARLIETAFEALRASRGGGILEVSGGVGLPEVVKGSMGFHRTSRPHHNSHSKRVDFSTLDLHGPEPGAGPCGLFLF
jgi:hypothetical protein